MSRTDYIVHETGPLSGSVSHLPHRAVFPVCYESDEPYYNWEHDSAWAKMRTEERIENITDRAAFESLVSAVLREADGNFKHILQSGVNTKGESVKSPADGFCLIPGSQPSHFIIVEYTTTDAAQLESKWLADPAKVKRRKTTKTPPKVGDLLKAAELADQLRFKFPDAIFTVVLASNQRISNDIAGKVYEFAQDHDLRIDIWDVFRLSHFLDFDRVGQWIRKEFLGVQPVLVSRSLLHEISEQRLESFRDTLFLADETTWVSRSIHQQIQESISNLNISLILLVGESGFGKSTATFQMLSEVTKEGGIGFWLSESTIVSSNTIELALETALKEHNGNLQEGAAEAVYYELKTSERLVIIVDDLNRSDSPSALLRKVAAWCRPNIGSSGKTAQLPVVVVCPVWPQVVAALGSQFAQLNWIDQIAVGRLTEEEAINAIVNVAANCHVSLSRRDCEIVAERLGRDAIFVAMYADIVKGANCRNRVELKASADNVMARFIEDCFSEARVLSDAANLPSDYREALHSLSESMLKERNISPSWATVVSWLQKSPQHLIAIRELIKQEKICRVRTSREGEVLSFRHDRILEAINVSTIQTWLRQGNNLNDMILDPYYVELFGKAICGGGIARDIIGFIRDNQPAVLFASFAYFEEPVDVIHFEIIDAMERVLQVNVPNGELGLPVIHDIESYLLNTVSSKLLEVTKYFNSSFYTQLARLRNGDILGGISYLSRYNEFSPSIGDAWRDQALADGLAVHRTQMLESLCALLQSKQPNDAISRGTLAIVGFIGEPELLQYLGDFWNQVEEKDSLLPEGIWAYLRCANENVCDEISGLLSQWSKTPSDEDDIGHSKRGWISESLKHAFTQGLNERAILCLIEWARSDAELAWPITYALSWTDHPDALSWMVSYFSSRVRELGKETNLYMLLFPVTDRWRPEMPHSKRLSSASKDRLRLIWQDPDQSEEAQEVAFKIWLSSLTKDDLPCLNKVDRGSRFYRDALWKIAALGDDSVQAEVLTVLSKSIHWLSVTSKIWTSEMLPVVTGIVENSVSKLASSGEGDNENSEYDICQFLMSIPIPDAELILNRIWESVRLRSYFIHVALYLHTEGLLRKANAALCELGRYAETLKYVNHHFGFDEATRSKMIRPEHVYCLVPYIDYLDEMATLSLYKAAKRLSLSQKLIIELRSKVDPQYLWREHYSDDNILEAFEKALDKRMSWWLNSDLGAMIESGIERETILKQLEKWLMIGADEAKLRIAAECIASVGDRASIGILERQIGADSAASLRKVLENTRYAVMRRTLT